MSVDIPDGFFEPPSNRPERWPDHPDLRKALEWFLEHIPANEWKGRRETATRRLFDSALGRLDDGDDGKFFSMEDTFGWYLFQCEAFLDHIWNYEPTYGSRIVPVFAAVGRCVDLLKDIEGVEVRVSRLVGSERRQPNGGLFELLVAAAYRRAGAEVKFVPELRGVGKTHDLDVSLDGRHLAVECKRLETSAYGNAERMRMRELWRPSSLELSKAERSTFCDAHFVVPIGEIPENYLTSKVSEWRATSLPSKLWNDEFGYGIVGDLDLSELQNVLATDNVLTASSRMQQLLTGRYVRTANIIQVARIKLAENPRYVEACNLAIVLRWETNAASAIDAKARDIVTRLARATEQLPPNRSSIIHIGFEAVDGDTVERARYQKILASTRKFDPGEKLLEYVYCHYFVPESPPDEAWAFDETTQWCPIRPTAAPPLGKVLLVVPDDKDAREGTHWD